MPVLVTWYIEHRVVYARYYGEITVEEMKENNAQLETHLDAAEAPAYILADARDAEKFPFSMSALWDVATGKPHPKLYWSLNVTPQRMQRFIATLLSQFNRVNSKQFATMEEALEFLQRLDKSLPDLSQIPLPTDVQHI